MASGSLAWYAGWRYLYQFYCQSNIPHPASPEFLVPVMVDVMSVTVSLGQERQMPVRSWLLADRLKLKRNFWFGQERVLVVG